MKRQVESADADAVKKARADPLVITEEERRSLQRNGFLVKMNVVSEGECAAAQAEFEAALKRIDPTFGPDSYRRMRGRTPKSIHGIQEMGELAHLDCVKRIRLHPNVATVWRSVLQEQDICSSWDRVNYMPAFTKPGRKPWHHTDVSPGFSADDYEPLQAYVQVSPSSVQCPTYEPSSVDSNSPCIVVWRHSHLAHASYFRRNDITKLKVKNWHVYDEETVKQWERDGSPDLSDADIRQHFGYRREVPFERVEVRVPRGAMVFWYSKTAHMNTAGSYLVPNSVEGDWLSPENGSPYERFVVYSCFGPRRLVSKRDSDNMKKALATCRTTSHWPCANQVKLFQKVPFRCEADYAEKVKRLDVRPLEFDTRERSLLAI